jgi:hypothetical protein
MWQALIGDHFGVEILYNFFEHLIVVKQKNWKLESCKSRRDLQFSYKNFIRRRIEELWFFKNSVLSRYFRWRDKTILSRQREWRDELFHVGKAIEYVVSCRANACGTTTLFGRASGTGATKGATWCKIFYGTINIKIFIKKGLKFKKNPHKFVSLV